MEDPLAARALAARKYAKLTQRQAEEHSGVRQSDISKIERGETVRPSGLVQLARAYRCDPIWLVTGEGRAPGRKPHCRARPTSRASATARTA